VTKVDCDRQDCKHWVDNECSLKKIKIREKTLPSEEEIAICETYEMFAGAC
jgi:hypothetical protein